MQNLFDELVLLLKRDTRFIADGKPLRNKIVEAALQLDPALLRLLLSDNVFKHYFFQDVDGVLVFDKIQFQAFVSNKAFLPDSFTSFKNKIGLTVNERYTTEEREVVLAWPYKDCLLEGSRNRRKKKEKSCFGMKDWPRTI